MTWCKVIKQLIRIFHIVPSGLLSVSEDPTSNREPSTKTSIFIRNGFPFFGFSVPVNFLNSLVSVSARNTTDAACFAATVSVSQVETLQLCVPLFEAFSEPNSYFVSRMSHRRSIRFGVDANFSRVSGHLHTSPSNAATALRSTTSPSRNATCAAAGKSSFPANLWRASESLSTRSHRNKAPSLRERGVCLDGALRIVSTNDCTFNLMS
mmetsp:Transcript_10602/g.39268  ORF Transcript_10602/g.39268 Transcript_10602/m.39268 type:complete len:209 (+) Transcript_10602:1606-2232(+)